LTIPQAAAVQASTPMTTSIEYAIKASIGLARS
jgi:hypothetical protein